MRVMPYELRRVRQGLRAAQSIEVQDTIGSDRSLTGLKRLPPHIRSIIGQKFAFLCQIMSMQSSGFQGSEAQWFDALGRQGASSKLTRPLF